MRRTAGLIIFFLVAVLLSCSKSVKDEKDSYVIRYVNLSKVYDYAVKNDSEAAPLRKKVKSSGGIKQESDVKMETGLVATEINERPETGNLSDDEKKAKSKIFGRIKTSVSNIARRHNADFVFNTGDAVIYSKPAYDITDDVIREYKKIQDISSPSLK